jgi:hypothetical protein
MRNMEFSLVLVLKLVEKWTWHKPDDECDKIMIGNFCKYATALLHKYDKTSDIQLLQALNKEIEYQKSSFNLVFTKEGMEIYRRFQEIQRALRADGSPILKTDSKKIASPVRNKAKSNDM